MRIGDHIRHGPTGEDWIVARVDDESVYPLGWPCERALRSDCTLMEPCTDEQRAKLINDLMGLPADDQRHVPPNAKITGPQEKSHDDR